jgi:hypothetical protein
MFESKVYFVDHNNDSHEMFHNGNYINLKHPEVAVSFSSMHPHGEELSHVVTRSYEIDEDSWKELVDDMVNKPVMGRGLGVGFAEYLEVEPHDGLREGALYEKSEEISNHEDIGIDKATIKARKVMLDEFLNCIPVDNLDYGTHRAVETFEDAMKLAYFTDPEAGCTPHRLLPLL